MGIHEREAYRELLGGMGKAILKDDLKAYGNALDRLPTFADAAGEIYHNTLKAREYDRLIENNKVDFVRIMYEKLEQLPVIDHLDRAGLHDQEKPLKAEIIGILLDSREFGELLKSKEDKHRDQANDILRDVMTHKSPESTKAVTHFINVSCPKHGLKVSKLAKILFRKLYVDQPTMAGADEVLVKNLSLFTPHIEEKQLVDFLNNIVINTKSSKSPKSNPLQESRLKAIIDYLPVDSIDAAMEALAEHPSGVKDILQKKQGTLHKIVNLHSHNAGDGQYQFEKLSIEEQRDILVKDFENDDVASFKNDLGMLRADRNNQAQHKQTANRLNPLVNTIIRADKADFLKVCIDADMDVLTEERLTLAGLIGNDALKPGVAQTMLATRSFKQKTAEDDPVLPRIFQKLTKDHSEEAQLFLESLEKSFIAAGKQIQLRDIAYAFLLQAVQENEAFLYDHECQKRVDTHVGRLSAEQCGTILQSLLSVNKHVSPEQAADLMSVLVQKMPKPAIERLLPLIAVNAGLEILRRIEEQSGATPLTPLEIMNACCGKVSAGLHHRDEVTLKTVNKLLDDNEFTADQIYSAMMDAIATTRPEHMKALLVYAKEFGMDIANRINTEEGNKTPLTAALSIADKKPRTLMADYLVQQAGADGRNDGKSNNPLTMMGSPPLNMQDSGAYKLLHKMQDSMIDFLYDGKRENARLEAQERTLALQFKMMERFIGLGLSPSEAKEMVRETLAGSQSDAPRISGPGEHTRRLEQKQDDTPPGAGFGGGGRK